MIKISKIHSMGLALSLILWGVTLAVPSAQEPHSVPVVETLRLGAHPEYTRILLALSEPAPYEVSPDFRAKEVTVFIPGARAGELLQSRSFPDRALGPIRVESLESGVRITLALINQNTRLFHFMQRDPAVIVLDFQGKTQPVIKARIRKSKPKTPVQPVQDQVPGLSPEQIQNLVKEDTERKLAQGDAEYQKALLQYQKLEFKKFVESVNKFETKYRGSPLLENLLYLKAEALFQIHNPELFPVYEAVIDAYQYAIRKYPKSAFYDHALLKLGIIFDNMNLPLEARTLYLEGVTRDSNSLYNPARRTGLAQMLLREKQFGDARKAFQDLLKADDKNSEATKGLFVIAEALYEQGDMTAARSLYEEASRWWTFQQKQKEISEPIPAQTKFIMGKIYFSLKEYDKARDHFFDVLNLNPESQSAHIGLNHIGDSYLNQGQGMAALSIFDKSQRKNPDSPEGQYAKIRLADIGVRNPTLPVRDIIFDLPEYFKPLQTYETVFENAKSQDILAEVTLSRGIAHMQQKQYLDAIGEFKKLIPLDPQSRHYKNARNFLMQALVLLIEDYVNQQGYLPALYVYNDFRNLNIGDIQNVETLLQVGESYQAVGMHNEALAFYERVKGNDPNGAFRDRLYLNLGRIQIDQSNYMEAEVVARTFLTNFPLSPRVPEAMKIIGASYKGRKEYDAALDMYGQLLTRADTDVSEAHYLMAETWFQSGNQEEAIREYALTLDTYDRTLRNVAEHVKSAYYKLGITLYQTQRFERTLEALLSARRLFPDHPLREWADFLIADSYDRTNNADEAVSEFQNMVKSPPEEPLLRQAAEIRIKVLDWEKRFKELL